MGGKLDIYNLGENGVDVVKSPLHQADGDLIQAQNAMPDPAGLEGGIRKRDGLARVNAAPLTGAIEGAINVPLPAPGTRTYYFGLCSQGGVPPANTWQSSIGGASGWTGRSTPSLPRAADYAFPGTAGSTMMQPCLSYRRRFYFVPDDPAAAEPSMIRVWDGAVDSILCRIPEIAGVEGIPSYLWMHDGELYCAVPSAFAVFKVDIVTGSIQRIGGSLDPDLPYGGCAHLNGIFVWGLGNVSATGQVWRLRPGETSFTLDRTAAGAVSYYMHGAVFNGDLYLGTWGQAVAAVVDKRQASNDAWSASLTGAALGGSMFTAFAVFNDLLFCVYRSATELLIKKFDGSSWTTDLDVLGAGYPNSYPAGVLAETNALFFAFAATEAAHPDAYVLRRTTAGVWSRPTTDANGNGMIAVIP
jgi:hypothetical protein